MKVLYSVHRYPPHIGGSEEVSRRVVDHLRARGHDVTVATSHHPARIPEQNSHVVQLHLSRSDLWPNVKPSERAEALRYRELFEQDWDIRFIYTAQNWPLDAVHDLIGTGSARDLFAPVGYSLLGTRGSDPYFQAIADVLPKFDHVVYHSDVYQDYEFAKERGLLDNAIVIPNGTDLTDLPFTVEEKHARRDTTLTTIGSHVRSKGHADFLTACKSTGLTGVLVAPRPVSRRERIRGCYHQCRARVALNRDARMVDGHDRRLLESTLADAQLFFLPSKIEAAPLVILEAMARATPWVSYDVGMVRTLSGGVVVSDLAEAVDTLKALARDPARRVALAEAGRKEIAERYEWSLVLPQYARLVESHP